MAGSQHIRCEWIGTYAMKSALKIIAFSKSDPAQAIVALLEVALEALDASDHRLPAAYVDMGLNTFLAQHSEKAERNFDGIAALQ